MDSRTRLAPLALAVLLSSRPSCDHAARLARLNLALQLDEGPIGVVNTPCQDCCNVKELARVLHEQGGRTGDVKLRLQCM
jgi:hypothetical protein